MEQNIVTFEDTLAQMARMSEDEIRRAMEENSKICESFCGGCPTYSGIGENNLLFCAKEKSEVITEEKGCLCIEGCTVQKNMGLRWSYYCTRGPGKDQIETE